ncbi:MAG TPA: hypothetical protein VL945_00545 [Candidatus Saccharimonadales bacterium]|nr:hypothetical protein [Candidatus Saccharimonadales bacterium]
MAVLVRHSNEAKNSLGTFRIAVAAAALGAMVAFPASESKASTILTITIPGAATALSNAMRNKTPPINTDNPALEVPNACNQPLNEGSNVSIQGTNPNEAKKPPEVYQGPILIPPPLFLRGTKPCEPEMNLQPPQ